MFRIQRLTRRKCLELSGSSSLLPHFNSTTHTIVTATCPNIWVIPKIDSVYILFTFILRLHITKNSHDLIQVQRSQYYTEQFRGVMSTSLFSCEWRRWLFWAGWMCFLYFDLRGRYIPKQSSNTKAFKEKWRPSQRSYVRCVLIPSLSKMSKLCV